MNMFLVFLDVYLGIKLLDNTTTLNFCATIKLFSKVNASYYMPSNNAQEFQYLHIHANTCSYPFLNYNHPSECEVVFHFF